MARRGSDSPEEAPDVAALWPVYRLGLAGERRRNLRLNAVLASMALGPLRARDPYKMELDTTDLGADLCSLLLLARDYRPNDNKDYYVPVDAAVAAILGGALFADRTQHLAFKNRCILNFLDRGSIMPCMPVLCRGGFVSWTYRDSMSKREDRRVGWVPSQEHAASSGWILTLTDYGNASVVSRDLMRLMLRCRKISRCKGELPTTYNRAIMNYFTVSEAEEYLDPLSILPVPGGPYRVPDPIGIDGLLKERYGTSWVDRLVAVLSNDSWWELYIRCLKRRVLASPEGDHYGASNVEWFRDMVAGLSKEHEMRVLELAAIGGDRRGLAHGCAYSSKGPLLSAALALPNQECVVYERLLKTICDRRDIDGDCAKALIAYLGRCDGDDMRRSVMGILREQEIVYTPLRPVHAGAARVLVGSTLGLEIIRSADEYMASMYFSGLLHGALALSVDPGFAFTLSFSYARVIEGLGPAATTLCEAGFYVRPGEAAAAVIENLLDMCPEDQKDLSRGLLGMMLGGADRRALVAAYVGHPSVAAQVEKATADRRRMGLFGLWYRPWLAEGERYADS